MTVRRLYSLVCALVILLFGSLWVPSPAAGRALGASTPACSISEKLQTSTAVLNLHVVDLANYHCSVNPHATILAEGRHMNEWAAPWDNRPCDSLPEHPQSQGSPFEQLEAECVTSWHEYSQYLSTHTGCLEEANAAALAHMPTSRDRIDLRPYCGEADLSAEYKAELRKDDAVLGGFGLVGCICLVIVIICVISGVAYSQ